jgi:hypothetical protein
MKPQERFKVRLDLGDSGAEVELSVGENRYSFLPTHVAYDSIRDLVDALGNLLSGYAQVNVRWNDEPAEHEFVFEKSGDQADFKVYFLKNTLLGLEREEVFATRGTVYEIIRPFWKALRDLEGRYTAEEFLRRWREPFPTNEMRHFNQRFEKLKIGIAQ